MSDPQNPTFETVTISELVTEPGYNPGATGLPVSNGWYGDTALFIPRVVLGSGMHNVINENVSKHGTGDWNITDLNVETRGGQVDAAAEGTSVLRPYLTYGLAPYMATIATGGQGANILTMSGTNNQAAGVGQTLLDMSASVACNITGVSPVGGNGAIDGNYALLTTDGTFTPSQQFTVTTMNNATLDPENKGSVQSLTLTPKVAGGAPLAVGSLVCVGGELPECMRALTVTPPAADGSQTITANLRFQHWPGTIAFVGGPAGMWLEQTQFTKNWLRFVSWVLGAVDSKTLAVFNVVPGGMDMGYFFTGPVMLYNGGIITDVRDAQGNANGLTISLADNNGVWLAGGPVEMPNHFTCMWQVYVSNVQGNNPHARGVHFRVQGSGSAFGGTGGGNVFQFKNQEPASSYQANGGKFIPAPFFQLQGYFGRFLDLDTPPQEPLILTPGGNGFCLVVLKDQAADILFDKAKGWVLNGPQATLPRATFNAQSGVSLGVTTIQGDDGGGTTSLTVDAPMLPQYGGAAIHSKGDVVVDGKLTVGGVNITGNPTTPPPTGRTATVKVGGTTLNFVNGLLQ